MEKIYRPMKWFKSQVTELSLWLLILTGCATASGPGSSLTSVDQKEAIELKLVSTPGRLEKSTYHSHVRTKVYQSGQITNEKDEVMDFKVESEGLAGEANINQMIRVVEKDGFADLHDMAFPEIGEELIVTLNPNGKVLKAGDYPRNSIFYVPPVSLPDRPVRVGDTWTLDSKWMSLKNGLPMHLSLISIFKGLYRCGVGDLCADLEISGGVKLMDPLPTGIKLTSNIQGRLLFNVNRGTLLWGDVRSEESFRQGEIWVHVSSCLESVLEEPNAERLVGESADCQPLDSRVEMKE